MQKTIKIGFATLAVIVTLAWPGCLKSTGHAPPSLAQQASFLAKLRSAQGHSNLAAHLESKWKTSPELAQAVLSSANAASRHHQLPPTLLLAVMAKESSFKTSARSPYGAKGLMQIVPRWHPEKFADGELDQVLDPTLNIRVGAAILKEYVRKSNGDVHRALERYSGQAAGYVRQVMQLKAQFDKVERQPAASRTAVAQ